MSHHRHHHGHQHHYADPGPRLIITMVLNFIITAVEVVGGLMSGSLSLISDALHNLSDGISVIISYLAYKLGKMPYTAQRTYGYKRAEVLAAVFNAAVLIVISVFLFKEAYHRLLDPQAIRGLLMLAVASVGLAANSASVVLLHRHSKDNLNIRSAYFHLLSDALSSVGVMIGGVFIHFYEIYWIDPVITVAIGIYIIHESMHILMSSLHILLQATPPGLDIVAVVARMGQEPGVRNPHHVHVWRLNENEVHLDAHFEMDAHTALCDADETRARLEEILAHEFHISHVTLQVEGDVCGDKRAVKDGSCVT